MRTGAREITRGAKDLGFTIAARSSAAAASASASAAALSLASADDDDADGKDADAATFINGTTTAGGSG